MVVFLAILISLFVIGIGCAIFFAIYTNRKKKLKLAEYDWVANHSLALKALKEINAHTFFGVVHNPPETHTYDNQNFFNSISCKDYLIYELQFKTKDYLERFRVVNLNKVYLAAYQKEIEEKCHLGLFDIAIPKQFRNVNNIELDLFKQNQFRPTTEAKINVLLTLTNYYHSKYYQRKGDSFDEATVRTLIKKMNNRNGKFYNDRDIWDAICRVERGRVSDRMRFAIYAKDGYRCRYCGKTDRTGHTLEIDHIIPIAKGGKSTMNNLQTLCHDCNYKKGDSIVSPYSKFSDK